MTQHFHFTLNCHDTAQLLSESMDRKPSLYARFRIYMHLRICRLCQAYKQHLHLLHDLLSVSPADLIDPQDSFAPGLSTKAKRRIIHALNALLRSRTHP